MDYNGELSYLVANLDSAIQQLLQQEDKRELIKNTEVNFVLYHFYKAVYGRIWVRIRCHELDLATNASLLSLVTILQQKLQEYTRIHGFL